MKEEKAKAIVEGLEMGINNGKMFRRYSKPDLIRFARMHEKQPDKPFNELLKEYDKKYPELTAVQKLDNISSALNLPGLKDL